MPVVIGIGGPSGSGKSELARRLARQLPGASSALSVDSYYRPLDHLAPAERSQVNFDHPGALDWDLFIAHLSRLSLGQPADEPVYLFDCHTRASESRPIAPSAFLIVEGIMALWRADVRRAMSLKIYVETPDEECFRRRLARDTLERGRTPESVHQQYNETVRPMARQYVWPTRSYADLVISGTQPLDVSVQSVLEALPPPGAAPA